jgi:predicted nucleic acid-binding protein
LSPLADTSVLVDYLRGVHASRELLEGAVAAGEDLAGSTLTRLELYIGMRPTEREATDALIAAVHWLPVNDAVIEDAETLARQYGRSHSGIDAVDYCVAASARVNQLMLWTLNVRHFPMFEDLKPPW